MKKISIVVPCYNERQALPFLLDEIKKVLTKQIEANKVEVIFINDGSTDGTLDLLRDYNRDFSWISYMSFSRNFGKESAIYAGLVNASGDYVAIMDADMQDPPSLLPEMISILDSGEYDSVATRRISRKGEPPIRSFFARRFYRIMNRISDADMKDGARDFRLMTRPMVDAIVSMSEVNRFSKGIFGWVGFNTYWIEYENVERVAGDTKWSFWGLVKYSMDGIVNFSVAPLTIVSGLGIFTTVVSFVGIIALVILKLCNAIDSAYGWASMVCLIALLSGIQMLGIGVVGQYVAKLYSEVKNRPHYIASETSDINFKKIF